MVSSAPGCLYAQFTDPRDYENTPVGVNQVEAVYAYGRSNTSLDTSIVVAGAKLNLNAGSISYIRSFGLFGHTAWVQPGLPFGNLNGSITGTQIRGSNTGMGDSSYQAGILLRGGKALSVAQFEDYHLATTVGTSLTVTAPTGEYGADKILNLGSNRWSFKPEFAISYPFGPQKKWVLDSYANIYFYTDNTSYHGTQRLRQKALPGIEEHVSYTFRNGAWVSLDTRYCFGGDTIVNGVNEGDSQENFTLGSELNLPLSTRNTLVFEFGELVVHVNGAAFGGFGVKYYYSWGKGYK